MDSNAAADSKRFHIIPTEIVEAWAKGDYYSGDAPSLSYRQLGEALSLRGWYTYGAPNLDPKKPDFKGVAKIELKGQQLMLGGIRLCAPKNAKDGKGVQAVRFWRSQYSFFYSENEIVWVYQVYSPPKDEKLLTQYREILAEYLGNFEAFPDVASKTAAEKFGFLPEAWDTLLQRLKNSFDTDIMIIEAGCPEDEAVKVLLHYNIDKKEGEYRTLYRPDDSNIAGLTHFSREPGGPEATREGGQR